MQPSTVKVTDLDFLQNFTGNDTARMRKYVSMFLGSAPAEMNAIRQSLAGQDWNALRAAAHSLKPQMVYMGVKSGEELLKTIEHDAGNTVIDRLPELVEQFDKLFVTACDELDAFLKQTEN